MTTFATQPGGAVGGVDNLWARLLQNNGTLSGWQQFTVTSPLDKTPVVTPTPFNVSASRNQSFVASSLFTVTDGDAPTETRCFSRTT